MAVLNSFSQSRSSRCGGFLRALDQTPRPAEVTTDRAQAYPRVLDELLPAACHVMDQCLNYPIEADHGRLKSRLRPMRGLTRLRSARVISTGHAFVQNLRRGHYDLATSNSGIGSQRPSPNSPPPSDREARSGESCPRSINATAPLPG